MERAVPIVSRRGVFSVYGLILRPKPPENQNSKRQIVRLEASVSRMRPFRVQDTPISTTPGRVHGRIPLRRGLCF